MFSVFAARTARQVYALEPAPSHFRLLVPNTSRFKNVVSLHWAHDGQAYLDVSANPVMFSLLNNISPVVGAQKSLRRHQLTLFAGYKIERRDYMKLDCAGADFEIILQSDPSVLNRESRIVLEYHDYLSTQYSHVDLLEQLESLGFQCLRYNANET